MQDAHQGNGHERDFLGDSDVYILDVYNPYIYPNDTRAKRAISSNILYHEGDKGPRFLAELEAELVTAVNEFRPEMVLYNAGTDCLEGDPLGNLDLTPQAIASRDELVFRVRTAGAGRAPGPYVCCSICVVLLCGCVLGLPLHLSFVLGRTV